MNERLTYLRSEEEKLKATIRLILSLALPLIVGHAVFYSSIGFTWAAVADVYHATAAAITLLLISKNKLYTALFYMITSATLVLGFHYWAHGLASGYPAYFFVVIIVSVLFRSPSLSIYPIFVVLFGIVAFVYLFAGRSREELLYPVPEQYERLLFLFNLGSAFLLSLFVLFRYRSKSVEIEKQWFKSSQLIQNVYDVSPRAHLMLTKKGVIVNANATTTENRLGVFAEQPIIQRDGLNIFPNNLLVEVDVLFRNALEGKRQLKTLEYMQAGDLRYYQMDFIPLFGPTGKVEWVNLTIEDVTEKQKDQQRLQRLALVAEHTNNGIVILGPDKKIKWVNRGFQTIFGYQPAAVEGKMLSEVITPTNPKAASCKAIEQAYLKEEAVSLECNTRHIKGDSRWIELNLQPVFNGKGQLINFIAIIQDITDRKAAAEQIEKSETLFQNVGRLAQLGTWEYNVTTQELYWSDQTYRIHGMQPGEPLHVMDVIQRIYQLSETEFTSLIQDVARKGEDSSQEFKITHPDGSKHWLQVTFYPQLENGQLTYLMGMAQDITATKQQREELAQISERLRVATEVTDIGIWEWTIGDDELFMTRQAFAVYGRKREDGPVSVTEWRSWIDESQYTELEQQFIAANETGKKINVELMVTTSSGNKRVVRSIGSPVDGGSGELKRILGVVYDITAEKEAQRELAESRALLNAINQNIKDGLYRSTWQGQFIYVNRTMRAMLGISEETPLEQVRVEAFYHRKADRKSFLEKLDQNGMVENDEILLQRADGTTFWGAVSANKTEDSEGNTIIDGSIRDITELRKARKDLIEAKNRAEEASRAKADFLSTMSHEIRTPMNAVIGMTELLLMEEPREDQLDHLETLNFSAHNLLNLINDILDYSKIEAGKIDLEEQEVDLRKVVNSIVQGLLPKARDKHIDLRAEIDSAVPYIIQTDGTRLSQVLNNLVGNAIKFTEEGAVVVQLEVSAVHGKEATLHIAVKDTGIGIAENKQALIFEQFAQANASITREYGGTGLGLAITKRLLELMNSQIQVESAMGKGSTFWFKLKVPVIQQDAASSTMAKAVNRGDHYYTFTGTKILVVEDNQINAKLAQRFLQKWNIDSEVAENGQIAVDKIRTSSYDLVLMDLQMPVMDGYAATREIRSFNPTIPILALTASALLDVQQKIQEVGMQDSVIKPVNPRELNRKLYVYLGAEKLAVSS